MLANVAGPLVDVIAVVELWRLSMDRCLRPLLSRLLSLDYSSYSACCHDRDRRNMYAGPVMIVINVF